MRCKFPLGIDEFAKLREDNFYYIDKTAFIKDLLGRSFEANLVTRPRRFGKTLTMSMLEGFFDINRDSRAHFEGLEISKSAALCDEWMNKYPTVFITLKGAEGLNFESALARLGIIISEFARARRFLTESDRVSEDDKNDLIALSAGTAPREILANSLLLFTRVMHAHYKKPVILLIDEYDVPLAKASENGYYADMLDVIRSLLGGVIKTNPHLKFAVVTGCLRISKESIFTGTNNFVTDTITGDVFSEHIGFTQADVDKILADADLQDHADEIKTWYDGYRFGDTEVYCPWDVLNHVSALQDNPNRQPKNYWGNTSHNGIIYQFISRTDLSVTTQFETLMAGGSIVVPVTESLTYDTLYSSEENLWSLLYLTGYLTCADESQLSELPKQGEMALRIPNEEIKILFKSAIIDRIHENIRTGNRDEFFRAVWSGDAKEVQDILSDLLFSTISYHDYQESYYHAFLTGMFAGVGYSVESNHEYGTGRPDIVVKDRKDRRALVLEIKRAKTEGEINTKLAEASGQIKDRKYLDGIERGYRTRYAYSVVFFEKECYIEKADEQRIEKP